MKTTNYLGPAQVAKMFSIKKDTLLFYDRIGLFQPDLRRENGYRAYSSAHLADLEAILSLKDLGFSLDSIANVISGNTAQAFLEYLDRESEALEEKMATLKTRQKIACDMRTRIRDALSKDMDRLYIDTFPAVPIEKEDVADPSPHTSNEVWEETYDRLVERCGRMNISAVGSIIDLEDALSGRPSRSQAVYAVVAKKTRTQIDAGRYACMYYRGPYVNIEDHYRKFFSQTDSAGLTLTGDIYEELTINTTVTRQEEDFITQIRVRIL